MIVNGGVEGKVTAVRDGGKKKSGVVFAELQCSFSLFSSVSSPLLPPTPPFLCPIVHKY